MPIQEKKGEPHLNLSTALSEAQTIIEAAEQRSAELMRQAQLSYEQASRQGFAEGYQAGLTQATAKALRLIEETSRLQESLAREGAKLALAIASNVVGEHIKVSPESAQKMALKALQESAIGDSVVLVVNPEDEAVVRGADREFRRITGGAPVGIEADEMVTRGGCIVRTEFGEVDARIETLLDSIAERLGLGPKES